MLGFTIKVRIRNKINNLEGFFFGMVKILNNINSLGRFFLKKKSFFFHFSPFFLRILNKFNSLERKRGQRKNFLRGPKSFQKVGKNLPKSGRILPNFVPFLSFIFFIFFYIIYIYKYMILLSILRKNREKGGFFSFSCNKINSLQRNEATTGAEG